MFGAFAYINFYSCEENPIMLKQEYPSALLNYCLVFILILLVSTTSSKSIAQEVKDSSVRINDGKITYEAPMVYELMHIAMALCDTNIVTNGYNVYKEVIENETDYYKEVMNYFGPYKNHSLIRKLNKSLKENANNYISNLQLAYNSAYISNTVKRNVILPLKNQIAYRLSSESRKELNEFAKITKFAEFYHQHKEYYTSMLKDVQLIADVNNQQIWLEKQFPKRYNRYYIVISPLMGGTHFTTRYIEGKEHHCIMYVSNFYHNKNRKASVNYALYSGVVITEIDHNYVNPVSDLYKGKLKELMGEKYRKIWTAGGFSNSYKNGYKVFNEYMTHAVYILYILEHSNISDHSTIENLKINAMMKHRSFIKFDKFYAELKQQYAKKSSTETIADLYPLMIAWCKKENELTP
jgi:hypothetical protein